jgi:hypothetical protein
MMVMRATSVVGSIAVLLMACAADDPTPSCQQALDHFYAASCTFVDSGAPVPKATAVSRCETLVAAAPRLCRDEVSDWLRCIDTVPSPASSDEQCSCSPEVMAVQSCQ